MSLPPFPKEADFRRLSRRELQKEISVASPGSLRRDMADAEQKRRDSRVKRVIALLSLAVTVLSSMATWVKHFKQ